MESGLIIFDADRSIVMSFRDSSKLDIAFFGEAAASFLLCFEDFFLLDWLLEEDSFFCVVLP